MLQVLEKEQFHTRSVGKSSMNGELHTLNHTLHHPRHRSLKPNARVVTFYKNGDRLLQGYPISITNRRYKTFDNLLSDLTRLTNLPMGARYILSPTTGRQVRRLEDLQGGKAYVCSSYRKLRKIHYGLPDNISVPIEPLKDTAVILNNNNNHHFNQKQQVLRKTTTLERHQERNELDATRQEAVNPDLMFWKSIPGQPAVKPRIITVIRNGHRPRHIVKVLLNRRTAQTFDQVLSGVTSAVGTDGGSGVRKLYDTNGRQIIELASLFKECDVFIAVGSERFEVSQVAKIVSESHERLNRFIQKTSLPPAVQSRHQQSNFLNKKSQKLPPITSASKRIDKEPVIDTADSSLVAIPTRQSQKFSKLPRIASRNGSQGSEDKTKRSSSPRKSSIRNRHTNDTERSRSPLKSAGREPSLPATPRRGSTSPSHRRNSIKHDLLDDSTRNVETLYEFGKRLGDGNFAIVRQCYDRKTRKSYAVKIIDRRKMRDKEEMLRNEIEIMMRCRHPNIAGLIEHFTNELEIHLIMELVLGGDLFDTISSSVKLSESLAASFARDIFSALDYLHKRKIVHRDVKPENLMVYETASGQKGLKLVDFGLAMDVKGPIFTVCGTPTYVAPEILKEHGYGLEVDVWAAGVITYIMLCGFPPFRSPGRRQSELFSMIEMGEFEFLEPYWDNVSQVAQRFIERILVVDIASRDTASQCLRHDWLTSRRLHRNNTIDSEAAIDGLNKTVSPRSNRFKTVALTIQGAQRLKNLAGALSRGERLLTHVS